MTECEMVRLGEVAFERVERFGSVQADRPVYGVDKSIGLTSEPRYQSANLSRYKRLEHGMFAYNPMRLNIGSIGFCSNDHAAGIVSPDYVVFECSDRLIPEFFDYHTKGRVWSNWLDLAGEGSVRERIYFRKLAQYELTLPSVGYQKAAVRVLAALDDKVDLNQRMNATLGEMAQAIFLDWFVDFGPVRRKMAMTQQGLASDPAAILGGLIPDPTQAAPFAAVFPARLGDDGLPVGWATAPLDEIADFLNGLALQKFPATKGEPSLPVIKIADLRNGVTSKTDRASRHLPQKYIIDDGDYIFSWSGSLMAKVWGEGEGALNQHLFKVTSERFPQWFYASWVQHHLAEFQMIAASKATTMGHIQRSHLKAAMTVCPDNDGLAAMDQLMRPLWEKMLSNDLQNRTLAETRDYLLPRLMSGKVRVADAERVVG